MVNKIIKAGVAAFAFMISGMVFATGNTVVTQTGCVGNLQGDCNGTFTSTAPAGRLRGDVIRMNLTGVASQKLGNAGQIKVPDIGAVDLYQYGDREIVFASFSLTNADLNPQGMSIPLRRILAESRGKYLWANSMVLVGQVERSQNRQAAPITVLSETFSEMKDLRNAQPISYKGIAPQVVRVTIPASKNQGTQIITIDFKKIKSAR